MATTILLADDSVTIQKVVELTFMDEDYEVVATSDGDSALERFAEIGPDLVIADVHMPGPDGYEVCRQIKAGHPAIPVLLLVGTFEQFDEEKAVEVAADGHLKKPFDSQDLLSQVESLISRSGSAAAEPAAGTAVESPTAVPLPDVPWAAVAEPAPPPVDAAEDQFPSYEPEPLSTDLEPPPLDALDAPAEADPFEPAVSATSPTDLEAPSLDTPALEEAVAAGKSAPESAPAAAAATNGSGPLSDDDVERIAKRVAEMVGEKLLREVAWEVIPDLAEVIIKERIRELESQVE